MLRETEPIHVSLLTLRANPLPPHPNHRGTFSSVQTKEKHHVIINLVVGQKAAGPGIRNFKFRMKANK